MKQARLPRITGERYARTPWSILRNRAMGGAEIKIYSYLYNKAYMTNEDYATVSNAELAEFYGYTRSTVTNAIARLKKHKIIDVEIIREKNLGIFSTRRIIRFLVEPK